MTLEELRAQLEQAITRAHERSAAIDAIRERIASTDDDGLEALERELVAAAEAFSEARAEVERCRENVRVEEERAAFLADNPVPSRTPIVVGATHDRTYRKGGQFSFFRDAWAMHHAADPSARERLERHGRENAAELRERGVQLRDVGTSAFSGLVVPQYLTELYAPLARAGSPLLSLARKLPLPAEGMTTNISRITTGTAVAAQASQNSAVQETDADDTLLTVDVRTYAGMQDVARQAIERGTMVDEVIYADLLRAYFSAVDSAAINADGTSGTHLGIRSTSGISSITYTDATPTLPELWPKVQDGVQRIESGLYANVEIVALMHPRRWAWMKAALDSSSRPFVTATRVEGYNPFGVGAGGEYGVTAWELGGLMVVTDGNMLTNLGAGTEDVVIVTAPGELFFWQEGDGMPRRFSFEQTNAPQSIRLAVWGDSAFSAGRYPLASSVIGGTGLIAPTF